MASSAHPSSLALELALDGVGVGSDAAGVALRDHVRRCVECSARLDAMRAFDAGAPVDVGVAPRASYSVLGPIGLAAALAGLWAVASSGPPSHARPQRIHQAAVESPHVVPQDTAMELPDDSGVEVATSGEYETDASSELGAATV